MTGVEGYKHEILKVQKQFYDQLKKQNLQTMQTNL